MTVNRLSRPLVLVVEDHRDAQEMLVDLLQLAGMDALAAERGDEALALVRERAPDVVLLDVDLPGALNGINVLGAIRDDPDRNATRIILLTAQNVAARTPEAEPADLVLLKPVDGEQLVTLIRRLLG